MARCCRWFITVPLTGAATPPTILNFPVRSQTVYQGLRNNKAAPRRRELSVKPREPLFSVLLAEAMQRGCETWTDGDYHHILGRKYGNVGATERFLFG
jgi:hypothetical protein